MAKTTEKNGGLLSLCCSSSTPDSDPPSRPVSVSRAGKSGIRTERQRASKVELTASQTSLKSEKSKGDLSKRFSATLQTKEPEKADTDIVVASIPNGQHATDIHAAAHLNALRSSEDAAAPIPGWKLPHPCLAAAWKQHSGTHEPKLEKYQTADNAAAAQKCRIRTPSDLSAIINTRNTTIDDSQHESFMLWLLDHTQGRTGQNITRGMTVATVAAGANPISGLVVGLFSAAVSLVIELGERFGELKEGLKSIDKVCDLLGQAEDRKMCDQINKTVVEAYTSILRFVCDADSLLHSSDIGLRDVTNWTRRVQDVAAGLESLVKELMQESAINTNQGVADLKDEHYMDQMAECKAELLKVGGNWVLDSDVGQPAKGTCEWLLEQDESVPIEWQNWRDTKESAMLLVTGGIGIGKSVFSEGVAKKLARADRAVAIYHCQDDNIHDTNEEVFRGLLYQLANQSPDASDALTKLWIEERDNKRQPQDLFATETAVRGVFSTSVQACKKDVIFIVDGLNECDEGTWQSVVADFSTIVGSETSKSIKVLIVAQPEPKILEYMDKIKQSKTIKHSDTIELGPIQAGKSEIEAVIDQYVDEFIRDRGVEWQANFLKKGLMENAEGNAQWVYVAVQGLPNMKKAQEPRLRELLSQMTRGGAKKFDGVYSALLRRKAENEVYLPFAQAALRIIAGAGRPLTVKELSFAMISMNRPDNSDVTTLEQLEGFADESQIEADLPPLVRFSGPERTVHLDHSALKEFILNVPAEHWLSSAKDIQKHRALQMQNINELLTELYLDFLSLPVFSELSHVESFRKLLPNRRFSDPLVAKSLLPRFYGYAAQNWPVHTAKTGLTGHLLQKALDLCQGESHQCENWWAAFLYSVGRINEKIYGPWCDAGVVAACFGSMDLARVVFDGPSTTPDIRQNTKRAVSRGQLDVLLLLHERGLASKSDVELCIERAMDLGMDHLVLKHVRRWRTGKSKDEFDTWPTLLKAVLYEEYGSFKELYDRESEATIRAKWGDLLLAVDPYPKRALFKEEARTRGSVQGLVEIISHFLRSRPKELLMHQPKPGLPLLHLVVRWNIPELLDLFLRECSQEERSFLLGDHRLSGGAYELKLGSSYQTVGLTSNMPLLHHAFFACDSEIPMVLLQHPEITASQFEHVDSAPRSFNILFYALRYQTELVVDALLKHKYFPRDFLNSRNKADETPLTFITRSFSSGEDHEKARIAKMLLDAGGDKIEVDQRPKGAQWTALCSAVSDGKLELCRVLIVDAGADWTEVLRFAPGEELPLLKVTTNFSDYRFDLDLFRKGLLDVIKERLKSRGQDLADVISAQSKDHAFNEKDVSLKQNPYDPHIPPTYELQAPPVGIKRTATMDFTPREVQRTTTF
ncbi:hypothetical protein K402DRAFT_403073 [Aulographum hederae CBS 113979]|uniref:Nephrocystin 3-like N-terminal domain-containing protein n=1 Tax=Aulographum hederae CBS 113979 TaxID=1176131 RepID=A0A6G1H3Q0_9PEZI|nr:hypothetical protein K402DRAFT_403073 [Aulographum hederae CBS 113979]